MLAERACIAWCVGVFFTFFLGSFGLGVYFREASSVFFLIGRGLWLGLVFVVFSLGRVLDRL